MQQDSPPGQPAAQRGKAPFGILAHRHDGGHPGGPQRTTFDHQPIVGQQSRLARGQDVREQRRLACPLAADEQHGAAASHEGGRVQIQHPRRGQRVQRGQFAHHAQKPDARHAVVGPRDDLDFGALHPVVAAVLAIRDHGGAVRLTPAGVGNQRAVEAETRHRPRGGLQLPGGQFREALRARHHADARAGLPGGFQREPRGEKLA